MQRVALVVDDSDVDEAKQRVDLDARLIRSRQRLPKHFDQLTPIESFAPLIIILDIPIEQVGRVRVVPLFLPVVYICKVLVYVDGEPSRAVLKCNAFSPSRSRLKVGIFALKGVVRVVKIS